MIASLSKPTGWNCTGLRTKNLLLLIVVCSWALARPVHAAARPVLADSTAGSCVVSDWSPFTPCTRTGLHRWAHTHSRSVQKAAADCPALIETLSCEVSRAPRPADEATAAQQAVSGLLVNLPLALSVGLNFPAAASNSSRNVPVTPELAAALAAGRQLWQQQASRTDRLQCSPYNGPADLLHQAATPIVGAGAQSSARLLSGPQLAAARAAFAAAAKAVAVEGAAAARSRGQRGSGSTSRLHPFRKAIALPGDSGKDGLLPNPAADATADVAWDGSNSMTATVVAGTSMSAAAAFTATEALHDGLVNTVPWLTVQDDPPKARPHQQPSSAGMHLNMTYDHSQKAATFNSVEGPAGSASSATNGLLLLAVEPHLTGVYGLDLSSTDAKQGLMSLPASDAVLKTNAGGGVGQLGVSLAGSWTQANLSAALGLQQGQQKQQGQAAFTITDLVLLYSAAPAVLYVAVQTNVPSLAVQDAPATINLRPGGAAALELFEPCEPVQGLQLSDVQLHLQPEGSLTGVASGRLANTAVSALATVAPSAPTAAGTMQEAGQDLSMVMTAETVGAGSLSDVITIITRKDPPVRLLQALQQQQQQQQRMQFSSVTLTYQSHKSRRRHAGGARARQGDVPEGGNFNMVAVPDIAAAPSLKQMLDAIGLSQESLTLRTSSISSVGSAFAVATQQPYALQLPAPFTASGPTLLTLQYGQQSTGHGSGSGSVAPADILITTSLEGTSTAGVRLPGVSTPVAVDLSTVTVTTPTAIVGTSDLAGGSAPVTGQLAGISVGAVGMAGLPFLQFGTLNVSAKAGFQPLSLQDLKLAGPTTAFGVYGSAEFGTGGPVVQQQGTGAADAPVALTAYLPSVDLPLLARSLGANMSLGVLNANIKGVRAQTASQGAKDAAAGGSGLEVAAELQMLGMSSYVNFDLSAEQGASLSATFVAGQINKVLMPRLLSAVSDALKSTHSAVKAAAAAAAGGQATLSSLVTDAQEALKQARQQLDQARAALTAANQKAVTKLQQTAAAAETASAAYHSARMQGGAALLEARNELNTADTAFNTAKTLAYKELNNAQQAYKDAITGHETFVRTAQDRVDALLEQTLQLRADYNSANILCNPTAAGLEHCKTAATAWVQYQSASAALDSAQTALQEAATVGPSAQQLQAAKAEFATRQAAANNVVSGAEWQARATAAAKLQAATAALAEAEGGRVATQMRAANAGFAKAQETARVTLSPAAQEYKAVTDAKHAYKAARAGLKAATGVTRLTPEELSAAATDLGAILAQIQSQQAALAALSGADAPAAAPADVGSLIRYDRINVGVAVSSASAPVLLGVSYSGAVGSGDQQQTLMGRFQVDVSSPNSEELGLVLADVLRDDALSAIKTAHRSLAALM